MNWLDIVLAVLLAGSIWSGARSGLARVAIGFGSLILAFLLSSWFYGLAARVWMDTVNSRSTANLLGFVTIFVLVMVLGAVVSKLVAIVFKMTGLSVVDRALGGLFGLVRGALAGTVIVMALLAFPLYPTPRTVSQSSLAPFVLGTARFLASLAPHDLRTQAHQNYERVRDGWSRAVRESR